MENFTMVEMLTYTEMENRIKELEKEISAYQNTKEEFQECIQRLETVLFSLPTAIMIIDTESHEIIEANPPALLMIGLPLELMVGANYHQFLSQLEDKSHISDLFSDNSEGLLIGSDGKEIPIHKTVVPVTYDGRKCILINFVDITVSKLAESERAQKEKLQGVVEMARAVCHEMNQPLQAVIGLSELLAMDAEENDPIFKNLKNIQEQADRMGEITKKLMKVTRYETKDYPGEKIIDIDKATSSEPTDTDITTNQLAVF